MHHYGSHISKSKEGWLPTLEAFHKAGATAAQIFVGNPMGTRMTDKSKADYETMGPQLQRFLKAKDFRLFIHSPYILNFAKDPKKEDPYWIDSLFNELKIAQAIGAQGCVLHMGKAVNQPVQQAVDNMYNNVCEVLARMRQYKMNVKLYLETSAGQGTELFPTVNNSLDDLAAFSKRFSKQDLVNLGFCVDTCHIFAAGYDISTPTQAEAFFKEWAEKIGMEHFGVVHFNNSEKPYGSRVDRHACIQHGKIGVDGLLHFLSLTYRHGIPAILETPGGGQELPIMIAVSKQSPLPNPTPPCQAVTFLENLIMQEDISKTTHPFKPEEEPVSKKKVQWKSKLSPA